MTEIAVEVDVELGGGLVVRIAAERGPAAQIAVAVADPELARAVTEAISAALADTAAQLAAATEQVAAAPVVRLRSRKGVVRESARVAGAVAIVPVTARNARHLAALIDGIRAAGALGIQLVWDGATPPRAEVERHVFAALERARATPGQPPVVLAPSVEPATALHILVAHRARDRTDAVRAPGQ